MSIIFRILFFAPIVFFFSCDNNLKKESDSATDDALVFSNDAEYSGVWINQKYLIDFPRAHSGNRVSITDTSIEYSLGFRKKLKDISSDNVRIVSIGAWLYVDSLISFKGLSIVASVDNSSKNIFWLSSNLENKITKAGEWIHVIDTVTLNTKQDPEDVFTGYIRNKTKSKVFIDDLEFRFYTK